MPFIDNFIVFCGDGMIESMLEPHMKDAAGASQLDVGVAFLILGGLYMTSSLIAGFVSLKTLLISINFCNSLRFPNGLNSECFFRQMAQLGFFPATMQRPGFEPKSIKLHRAETF